MIRWDGAPLTSYFTLLTKPGCLGMPVLITRKVRRKVRRKRKVRPGAGAAFSDDSVSTCYQITMPITRTKNV
jgi:hypothetical protein